MSDIELAIRDVADAWLRGETVGDPRWRLKQLHGLHQLVLELRQQIIQHLEKGSSSFLDLQ